VYETLRHRVVEAFGESGRLAVVRDPPALHRHPSALADGRAS
jgi:hypothetical protein